MVGSKKQDFWPKINLLKGKHCIVRIWGAPVLQKLGMILKNKVVQKLKIEEKCLLQKMLRIGDCEKLSFLELAILIFFP